MCVKKAASGGGGVEVLADQRILIVVPVGRATYDEYDTPAGWRQAIQAGDLKRETVVTVYLNDDPPYSTPARQVEQLQPLFDELLGVAAGRGKKAKVAEAATDPAADAAGPEPSAMAEAEGEGASGPAERPPASAGESEVIKVSMASSVAGAASGDAGRSAETNDEQAGETSQEPEDSTPEYDWTRVETDPDKRKKGVHPAVWIFGALFLVLGLVRCVGGLGDNGPGSSMSSPGMDSATDAAATDAAAAAAAAAPPTYEGYTVRDVNLRSGPDRNAALSGELGRGAAVVGEWVDAGGERWLRLTSGPYAGAYAWSGNLNERAPPPLFGSGRTLEAVQDQSIYQAPQYNSSILGTVTTGQRIQTVGQTDSGWVEIPMEGLGVGYVRIEGLAEPAPEPVVSDIDVAAAAAPAADTCREVRREVGQMTEVQTYCRDRRGAWVPRGRPTRVQTEKEPEPAPPPPPPPAAPAGPRYITNFVFAEQPTQAQQDRLIPVRARNEGQGGRVSLDCGIDGAGRLQDCRVIGEEPTGWEFGTAALRSVRHYRVPRTNNAGQPTAGGRVRFAIGFRIENE